MKPSDFASLNDLGLKLWNEGKRKEAFAIFLEAVERFPKVATAHANVAFVFLRGGALEEARAHYETALRLDPKHADAKRGLAAVLAQSGAAAGAAGLREVAGSENAVTALPYRGRTKPVRLLLLVSLGSGNLQIERLLDDRIFAVTKLIVELFGQDHALPPHDLIFNGIGDADACAEALSLAQRIVAAAPQAKVVNAPERVLLTTRVGNAERLHGLPGVVTPRTRLITRPAAPGDLEREGFALPLLLRSPGHHTGHHFELIARDADLPRALETVPGEQLYAIEYLDVRNDDGKVRKYRVMFVDGRLYPLHLAISGNWKVHYFSADMADVPEHRAEDERFLNAMPEVLGGQAIQALQAIASTLGLDYAGIDFALTGDGRVVVFETNATMVVVQPADEERWAYRRGPVLRVTEAVREMLLARAGARV